MRQRFSRIVLSSVVGNSSICSWTKRLRKARESILRPPYVPGGFCVAKSMNCGCGRTVSPVSGSSNSRLSSSSRLSASSTSEGARLSSSSTIQ